MNAMASRIHLLPSPLSGVWSYYCLHWPTLCRVTYPPFVLFRLVGVEKAETIPRLLGIAIPRRHALLSHSDMRCCPDQRGKIEQAASWRCLNVSVRA